MKKSSQNPPLNRLTTNQNIEIEFLYLDLEVCRRCIGTNQNLDQALIEVSGILKSAGKKVNVRKILVKTEEQAQALAFFSSPTIRVNGQDIALESRQSRCEDCEACACNGEVNCRVWVFQGKEYNEAPTPMIIDAILSAAYGGSQETLPKLVSYKRVPDDLKRFFSGKKSQRVKDSNSCCPPEQEEACCDPSEKTECCDTTEPKTCGCKINDMGLQ